MRKIYLVDSENVGDVWVPLLVSSQPEEEVLVFYTQKSPHMNYENVRLLKETQKEAVFIKCFEGNNALDFQLVTELGYRLREDADSEYIIVSNDTGFDAAVRYWTERQQKVSRLSGKECYRRTTGKKPGREHRVKENELLPAPPNTGQEEAAERTDSSDPEKSGVKTAYTRQDKPVVRPSSGNGEQVLTETSSGNEEQVPAETLSAGQEAAAKTAEASPGAKAAEKAETPGNDAAVKAVQKKPAAKKAKAEQEETAMETVEEAEARIVEAVREEPAAKAAAAAWRESSARAEVSASEDKLPVPEQTGLSETEISADAGILAEDVVKSLFFCIRKDNLVDFHNALVAFLGEESGKALYQEIKGNAGHTAYWAALPVSGQKEKFEVYCRLVFDHSEFAGDAPGDFAEFLYESNGKRKNLNSLRAALLSRYGKDKGMKYYSLFKSHIKIMNHM